MDTGSRMTLLTTYLFTLGIIQVMIRTITISICLPNF